MAVIHGQFIVFAAVAAVALAPTPVFAQDKEEVVRGRQPDMRDIAVTPITDLNLSRDEIPEILKQAVLHPYADEGLGKCDGIAEAIFDLDMVLGPDIDISDEEDGISFGKAAQSAIGSFIPFRGIIREVSGAAKHQRQFRSAIFAGAVRRGYLKGVGQQMGCAYPARPAFERVRVTDEDRVDPDAPQEPQEPELTEGADGVTFYSDPVVQGN